MYISLLEGLKWGLLLSIMVGPILFTIVQTSISKGVKAGLLVAFGVYLSDVAVISLMVYATKFIQPYIEDDTFKLTIGILGFIVLLSLGLFYIFTAKKENAPISLSSKRAVSALILQGIAVNTINPFTFIFWFTLISAQTTIATNEGGNLMLFILTLLHVILFTDSLKAYFGHQINRFLQPKKLAQLKKLIGLTLIIFGAVLLVRLSF